eukprot:4259628-Prymnesium_polylepis.1
MDGHVAAGNLCRTARAPCMKRARAGTLCGQHLHFAARACAHTVDRPGAIIAPPRHAQSAARQAVHVRTSLLSLWIVP